VCRSTLLVGIASHTFQTASPKDSSSLRRPLHEPAVATAARAKGILAFFSNFACKSEAKRRAMVWNGFGGFQLTRAIYIFGTGGLLSESQARATKSGSSRHRWVRTAIPAPHCSPAISAGEVRRTPHTKGQPESCCPECKVHVRGTHWSRMGGLTCSRASPQS
jgi:hypothetical protein